MKSIFQKILTLILISPIFLFGAMVEILLQS
uniref:Uncharacterized protein n=1 Tax=Campylobacter jejuni subsp. jejuni serotype O:23/36 (strain 81-176) TaxID=354242 RepID=Q8GJA5_CAMJJ|nr:unknown [Campylobacter jejuni subsp. jejuni 81-176]